MAIDDFGTGYSSLQYSRRLEADELKIDRTFVDAIQNDGRERVLVECVLSLGEALGMDVIAEGVETDQHRGCLLEMGAKWAQGYHFARPMAPEEFEAEYLGDDSP